MASPSTSAPRRAPIPRSARSRSTRPAGRTTTPTASTRPPTRSPGGSPSSAAADAFRGVLALYASDARLSVQADIEHEAEQYFVYSLAAAGGAEAFARAFPPGRAEPPYERRVLREMGQHFRRYGELPRAVAVDQLFLERWPGDAAAP